VSLSCLSSSSASASASIRLTLLGEVVVAPTDFHTLHAPIATGMPIDPVPRTPSEWLTLASPSS
jgi:hypothetical protein